MPTPIEDPWDLTIGAGSVWVTQVNGELIRMDAQTGSIKATIRPPSGQFGSAVAYGADAVWLTSYERLASRRRWCGSPLTNEAVVSLASRHVARTHSIAVGNDAVWLGGPDHFIVQV